jgi:glycosyltransferase involved in cell wall biosynthesis
MSTEKAQKILIVSYHFPPDNRVGAIRPAKFAKYLSRFGWQPYILTVKEQYFQNKDADRLKEVGNLPITRTAMWPTLLEILVEARNRLFLVFKIKGKAKEMGVSRGSSASVDSKKEKRAGGALRLFSLSIKRYFISIFGVPDEVNGWFIPAVWSGYWLIKREGIRIIMTSSPPRTTALIGLVLSKLTGAKLLTDLRDPWFLLGGKPENLRCALTDKVELWLEKCIMIHSDKVITTTDQYTQFLHAHYSFVPRDKFYTLHNGYDEEDFIGLERVESNRKFTLSYLGTFYFTRSPREFLSALGQLLKDGVISPHEVEVNFFGNVRSASGGLVEDLIKFYGLTECVHLREMLPYRKSLLEMKKSDILLLFAPDDDEQYYAIPGKTFEYIGAEGQILCIGDKGATAELIKKSGSGVVVNMCNVDEIKNAIKDLYLAWKSGRQLTSNFDKRVFERKELTRELLQLLIP